MDTYDRLARILADEYKIPVEKLSPAARLEDLGVDSLGVMELLFKIEDEFGISIPADQNDMVTVEDLVNHIDLLMNTDTAPAPQQGQG